MAAIRKNTAEVTVLTKLNKSQYAKVKEIQKKHKLLTQGMAVAKIISMQIKDDKNIYNV